MNELVVFSNPQRAYPSDVPTMGSREIAELTGKQHKNVIADIRIMLTALDLQSADFSAEYKDGRGRLQLEFRLPKTECLTLVTGYSIPLRHRMVRRWQELEAQDGQKLITLPDFNNPAIAARSWADQYERASFAEQKVSKLLVENLSMAPKVAAFEALCDAEGTVNLTDAGKILETGGRRLKQALTCRKHLNSRGLPYQPLVDSGRFIIRTTEANGRMWPQPRVTAKGLAWLAKNKAVLLGVIDELAPLRKRKAA